MKLPYVTYAQEKPGPKSLFLKTAHQKSHALIRGRTLQENREVRKKMADLFRVPSGVSVRPGEVGGVPCEWISKKESNPNKVILHLHGGGWIFGGEGSNRPAGVFLAEQSRYTVLMADYRLAPEHPYPAGLEDCLRVYQALLLSGFAPGAIGIFGDSAGGNLSLCLQHKLKELNLPHPAAIALASPVTDLRATSEIRIQKPDLVYVQEQGEEEDIFSLYLQGQDASDPLISPVLGDMSGFPPTLIHVGGDEALCEDNIAFAREAHSQGVEVLC